MLDTAGIRKRLNKLDEYGQILRELRAVEQNLETFQVFAQEVIRFVRRWRAGEEGHG